MIYWPSKTEPENVVRGADWRPALSKLGDKTIVDSEWTRMEGDAEIDAGYVDADLRGTGAMISGGTAGVLTRFRNTVTLDDASILTCDGCIRTRA